MSAWRIHVPVVVVINGSLSFIAVQSSLAAEIGTHNYDIYVGDINDDGEDDFYFHGKPLTLILHGEIATPILLHAPMSFVIYRNDQAYLSPSQYMLTSIDLAVRVAAGTLKRYQLNYDFYIWSNGSAGLNNVLLRGRDSYAPALLLTSSTNNAFPLLSHVYNTSDSINLSDRYQPITLQDINYDGRKDIILGSYTSSSGAYAYVADSGGIPAAQPLELIPSTDSPLPSGATHVGTTAGEFRVDESGAATYSIPFMVPQGTAGVAPQLSLNYSSLGANGIAGKGWSLGGLSAITRCRQTLVQDGASTAINWSSQDRFCIDGQRLMLVSGTYGAANSTYKTELDNFTLITAKGGSTGHPAYFLIEAKDGSTSVYGYTTDAKATGGATNTTLTWLLNRYQDNVGNGIDFVYEGNAIEGHRIKAIHYAFPSINSSVTSPARTDSHARVTFDYETRNDIHPAYIAGYAFGMTKRLSRIRVINEEAELRRYNLGYMSSQTSGDRYKNKISRLQYIQECRQMDSATSACLPATTFNWGGGTHVALDAVTERVNFPDVKNDRYLLNHLFADITGDGKQDFIYLMYEESYATSSLPRRAGLSVYIKYAGITTTSKISLGMVNDYNRIKIAMVDYNADGRHDLALYNGSVWKIYLSTPRPDGEWRIDLSSTIISDTQLGQESIHFADINGDGLVDAIYANGYRLLQRNGEPNSSNKAYSFGNLISFRWDSAANFPQIPALTPSYSSLSNCRHVHFDPSILPESMGDFNGDGVADFIGNYKRVISCTPPNGSGSVSATIDNYFVVTFEQGTFKNYSQELVIGASKAVDLNGDGLSDLVYTTSPNKVHYRLNNGRGFNSAIAWVDLPSYNANTYPQKAIPQFLDYNGDGATDIVWQDRFTEKLMVRLWGDTTSTIIHSTRSQNKDSHLLMDIDGDAVLDYIQVTSTSLIAHKGRMSVAGRPIPCYYISTPAGQQCVGGNPNPSDPVPNDEQHNAIVSIENGLGGITKISYGTLSNSGHYSTADVNAIVTQQTYPAYCSPSPRCYAAYSFSVAKVDSFYSRLNGGWDLPDNSVTLIPGNQSKGAPVLEVNGAMHIVTEVQSSAPVAGDFNARSKIKYFYGEAKMQASGRGFLGFNRLTTVDQQTGISTTTGYRQDFPFNGQPLSTTVHSKYGSAGSLLSSAENEWDFKVSVGPDNTKRYQVFVKSSTEKSYALKSNGSEQGDLLQSVVTETEFHPDDYGNVKNIKVSTTGGSLTVVKNTYSEYGSSDWEKKMGRLSRVVVTTNNDNINQRMSTFEYYGQGEVGGARGMLKREIVEPGNTLGTATTYTYDGFGNKVTVSTAAQGSSGEEEIRSIYTTYKDNRGRYIESTSNSLGHTSTINSINSFGAPTKTTDANGLSTTILYDALGAEYMRKDATGAWSRIDTVYCAQAQDCPAGAAYRSWKRAAGGGGAIEYFDILGRNIRTTTIGFDGRRIHVDTEYDHLSRVKRQSNPFYDGGSTSGWSINNYDLLGRVIKVIGPDGSAVTTTYNNNTVTVTNDLQQKRTETRNALGQLVQVEDHLKGTASYIYDIDGNLISATTTADNRAVTVRMCYDNFGRKVAMYDPDKGGFNIGATYKGGANANKTCDEVNASVAGTRLDGWWYYSYSGFGELITQIDAKGQKTTMTYDPLGRVKTRTDYKANNAVEGYTAWFYDAAEGGAAQVGAKGQVTAVVMNTGGGRSVCSIGALDCYRSFYSYDSLGRSTATHVYHPGDSTAYTTTVTYDKFGRTSHQYDALHQLIKNNGTPQNSGVEIRYNLHGYEQEVIDLGSGQRLKKILATNARGQVTGLLRGNGATTTNTYNEITGHLTRQHAGVLSPIKLIQNIGYEWDRIGNLKYRHNQSAKVGSGNNNLQERFCYDNLNRLTTTYLGSLTGSCSAGGVQSSVIYDGHGNIASKTGVGSYIYGNQAGPHAVTATSAGNKTYQYDKNGNMTSDRDNGTLNRSFEYTTYDQVSRIVKGSAEVTFDYGPDRNRWRRVDVKNGVATLTRYLGSIERVETEHTGVVEWKRNVSGALFTYKTDSANNLLANGISTAFIYNDHLGSVDIITDAVGTLTHSMSFDVWGARRSAEAWNNAYDISKLKLTGFNHDVTKRGYTGHEMVDEMGIIHMNGRIYDAKLARFLQADPFIQAATNTQNYNRYSYVLNNPLNMTDPSGFLFKKLYKGFMKSSGAWHTHKLLNDHAPSFVPFISAVLNFIPGIGPLLSAAFSANNAFYLTGSATTGAKAFAISRASSFIFQQINMSGTAASETVFLNAMAGGVISVLQGGEFGHGFVSAGFVSMSAGGINRIQNPMGSLVANMIVGGTASKLSGGKFGNGAQTAAFMWALRVGANKVREAQLDSSGNTRRTLTDAEKSAVRKLLGEFRDVVVEASEGNVFYDGELPAAARRLANQEPTWATSGTASVTTGSPGNPRFGDLTIGPDFFELGTPPELTIDQTKFTMSKSLKYQQVFRLRHEAEHLLYRNRTLPVPVDGDRTVPGSMEHEASRRAFDWTRDNFHRFK